MVGRHPRAGGSKEISRWCNHRSCRPSATDPALRPGRGREGDACPTTIECLSRSLRGAVSWARCVVSKPGYLLASLRLTMEGRSAHSGDHTSPIACARRLCRASVVMNSAA